MKVRKGRLRLSPNEEAQVIKDETLRRRKLRLQQVREQSNEHAATIRNNVKAERHRLLMKAATDIKVGFVECFQVSSHIFTCFQVSLHVLL